jgi:hypothetical protein
MKPNQLNTPQMHKTRKFFFWELCVYIDMYAYLIRARVYVVYVEAEKYFNLKYYTRSLKGDF